MDRWIARDLAVNWHPYTQMKDCGRLPPLLIEKAQGLKLYDARGKFYYDTISSWWCNVHGHGHPAIKKAVKRQLDTLEHVLFAGFTHKPAILLAEELIAIAPKPLRRVFFSDNGSTAVETALKMSFQYWQNTGRRRKTRFVALDRGYHGDTVGTMSIGGVGLFNKVFSPLFFPSYKVPSPYCYRCPMGTEPRSCAVDCAGPLEDLLRKKGAETAALVLEPLVMAAGGMIIYPKRYLAEAARLAKQYNVHLIVDEVATGFGRTGRMFASAHVGIAPDFLCLSKGVTSGHLPFAATLTTEKIYRAFYADYRLKKTFYHGHTYAANPLGCAAALASLEVFRKERVLERAGRTAAVFARGLERFRALDAVGDVRHIGLVGALELVKDKPSKRPFGFTERKGLEVYRRGLAKNLILRPLGDIVYLFLPLCVTEREVGDILERTYGIIRAL